MGAGVFTTNDDVASGRDIVAGHDSAPTTGTTVAPHERGIVAEAGEAGLGAYDRRLFEEGRAPWGRLPRDRPGARSLPPSLLPLALPGRRVRGTFGLAVLSPEALRSAPGDRPGAGAPRPMLSRRAVGVAAAIAALAAGALAAFPFRYHPPVAVMEPGPPIDVVRDIPVRDRVVDRPTGRYLLSSGRRV